MHKERLGSVRGGFVFFFVPPLKQEGSSGSIDLIQALLLFLLLHLLQQLKGRFHVVGGLMTSWLYIYKRSRVSEVPEGKHIPAHRNKLENEEQPA